MRAWREEMVIARERQARGLPPFTRTVVKRATKSWLTCAVGEQRRRHPGVLGYHWTHPVSIFESPSLIPNDEVLQEVGGMFGLGFGLAVNDQDVAAAERALDAIEDRVVELKREA